MYEAGTPLPEIRRAIEEKYAELPGGQPTPTPLPPSS
jgi:hypothetical protein